MFVYRAIDRYIETSSVSDRKRSGRPRNVRTKKRLEGLAVNNFPIERMRATINNWLQILKDHIAANMFYIFLMILY